MRRWIALLFAAVLLVAAAGCNKYSENTVKTPVPPAPRTQS